MSLALLAFRVASELAELAASEPSGRDRARAARMANATARAGRRLDGPSPYVDPVEWEEINADATRATRGAGKTVEQLETELAEMRAELARRDAEMSDAWTGDEK